MDKTPSGEKGWTEKHEEQQYTKSNVFQEENDDLIPDSRHWLLRVVAVVCLLAFTGLALPSLSILLKGLPAFLKQSRDLTSQEIVRSSLPAVAKVEAIKPDNLFSSNNRQGTAFNIRPSGLLITNQHVVEGAREVKISFADGRTFYSKTMKQVAGLDLAVIEINGQNLPELGLDDGPRPALGDVLTIIGNPLGYERVPVSGPLLNYVSFAYPGLQVMIIQASVAPGSSGSPVLNKKGLVVGIVYAQSNSSGESGTGQALAIPLAGLKQELLSSIP